MALNVSEEWLREYCRRTGQPLPHEMEAPRRKAKYGNEKTETAEGEVLDSKHEARVYEELRLQGRAGEIKGLARQVTFYLPGGIKYIADFVTINRDDTYTVMDAKSEATRRDKVYRMKRRQMKECLGIEITEV